MTTFLKLNESIINEVVRRLNQDLGAYIGAINAAVTDGYTIDSPVEVLDYPPPIRLLTEFPTLAVFEGGTRFEDDTGFSATGVHRLTVIAFVQDMDQRALAWKLRRYSQAITSCVLSGRTLPPDGWGTVLESIDPGPTLGRRDNPETRLSWVALTFIARTDQDA